MENTATHNGTNTSTTATKKPRKQRYLPGLPIASSAKDSTKGVLDVLVSRTPSEFSALSNYELFSTVDDGSDPMVRISVSKAARLSDGKPFPTNGGRVYKLRLTNYRPQQPQNQSQGDS
jgi:hypothetical protein